MATKKAISRQEHCKEPATPHRIQWPGARRRRGQKRKRAGPSAEPEHPQGRATGTQPAWKPRRSKANSKQPARTCQIGTENSGCIKRVRCCAPMCVVLANPLIQPLTCQMQVFAAPRECLCNAIGFQSPIILCVIFVGTNKKNKKLCNA